MTDQYDNPNPFLVLVGPPGCGKSTWAKQHFRRPEIVSSDGLRAQVADRAGDMRATPYAFTALYAIVEGRTALGKTVVVDATNRTSAEREKFSDIAMRFRRPANLVVFQTPLDVCLARNARRPKWRRVPEDWIRETHAMTESDFDPATSWWPHPFDGILFVRHEAHGYAGGYLTMGRYQQEPWMDCARETPPASFTGPGRWPNYHFSGWELRATT